MPSDPNIILQAGTNIQPYDPGQAMSMFGFAQQVQQMRVNTAKQNALLKIFSDPNSIDQKTGLPTSQTNAQVMRLDPEMGMKLQDQTLEEQVKIAQAKHYQTEIGKANFDFGSTVAGIGYDAYSDTLKATGSESKAIAAGQAARNDAAKNNGGQVGDDVVEGIISTPFKPSAAKAYAGSNKEWATLQHDESLDTERTTHDRAMEDIDRANAGLAPSGGTTSSPITEEYAATTIKNLFPGAVVNSTGRDPKENAAAKGAAHSDHLETIPGDPNSGQAIDIRAAKGTTRADVEAKLKSADFPYTQVLQEIGGKPTTEPVFHIAWAPKGGAQTAPAPLGKGAKEFTDSDGTQFYMNPAHPGRAQLIDGTAYTPKSATPVSSSGSGTFTPKMGALMAALAEQGVSLPSGFRSKQQQTELYQGLLDRNPGKTPDEIAQLVKTGQIEFGAQKKETQTAAGVAGKVEVAQNEINQFIPLVEEASAKVPRGQFVPLTRLMQTADTSISDPNLKALKIRINSLLNAYDLLASRGGTDVAKREEVRNLLTSADSPQALAAALDSFKKEATAAHKAAVDATRVPELPDSEGRSPAARPASSAKVLQYDAQGNLVQ